MFELDLHREGGDHEHRQVRAARLRGRHVPRERDALQRVVVDRASARGAATSSHFGSSRFRRTAWSRLPPPSAPAAPQRPHRRSPPASSSRTTSATPARTRTRTRSRTRRSRRFQLQACNATITGRVYHDRDQSGAFAVNPSSPTSDIAKQGWTVTLQRKTGATTYTTVDSDSSDANGMYSVEGPIGSDFRLCVTAPAPDSSSSWGVRAVTGVTRVDGCAPISPTSDAAKAGLSVLNLSSAGATGQDFAVVPITTPNFGAGDTATDRELHRHGRRQRDQGPAALRARDVDRQQRPPVLRVRADQRLHGLLRQDLPARADVRLDQAERSRADPPGRARLRRHRALHRRSRRCRTASRILAWRGEHPARGPASFRQAQPRASSRGIRRRSATVRSRMHRSTSRSSSTRRTTVAGEGPNPAPLAVIADALHEALCLLQRVGGIRLPTLQLGERCEGP